MNTFATLSKSPENLFPNITPEYTALVRSNIQLKDEDWSFDPDSEMFTPSQYEEPFDLQKPDYNTFPLKPFPPIKKGNTFSLLSFFCSANVTSLVKCLHSDASPNANATITHFVHLGVEESLRDKKFVLLLCVFLPVRWSQAAVGQLLRLSLVSSELLSSQPDFEMVLLAKMRKDHTTGDDFDEDTFNHFMSTSFPGRLAVPYSSHEARDILCQKLGFHGELKGLLVDNDKHHFTRRVLMGDVSFFVDVYASIGFPLTYERLQCRDHNRPSHISLAWLLGCDPSYRLENMKSSKVMSIEQLNEKVVALYLCQCGDKLTSLHEVQHQCTLKGLDFEIIIVCMPFIDSMHPYVFQHEIFSLANESEELDISSWWVFPYRTSNCVRLWHLAQIKHSGSDAMVIFGPNSSYVDFFAGEVARLFGVDAYPFTRDAIAGKYVDKADEVTLLSLLNGESVDYLVEPGGHRVPLTYLCGKSVLLYVEYPPWCMKTCDIFRKWYDMFKKRRPRSSFELVLVSTGEDMHPLMERPPRGVTPLLYISDSKHSEFLQNHDAFFKWAHMNKVATGLDSPTVIAFRKDGHINMLNALDHLIPHGLNEDPFDPECYNLGYEVINMMSETLEFMTELLEDEDEP